jgi:hypothetical protein
MVDRLEDPDLGVAKMKFLLLSAHGARGGLTAFSARRLFAANSDYINLPTMSDIGRNSIRCWVMASRGDTGEAEPRVRSYKAASSIF